MPSENPVEESQLEQHFDAYVAREIALAKPLKEAISEVNMQLVHTECLTQILEMARNGEFHLSYICQLNFSKVKDLQATMNYLKFLLESEGFVVKYYGDNSLDISWDKDPCPH